MTRETLHIMLVDDDASIAPLIRRHLKVALEDNFDLISFTTSKDALASLDSVSVDAILLDYSLDGETALDVLRELSAQGYRIPVIILTAHQDPIVAANVIKNGAVDYLTKDSLNPSYLVEALIRAIHRGEQDRLAEDRSRMTALLADVGGAVCRTADLNSLVQECCEFLCRHLDAAFARIWTLNEYEQVLELQASAGMYTHIDGEHSRVPVGKLKIGWIAEHRKPHLTNDVQNDQRIGDPEWAKREKMIAFAGYPLIVADQLIGVMAFFAKQHLREAVLEVAGTVANTVAIGIKERKERVHLYRLLHLVESTSDFVGFANRQGAVLHLNNSLKKAVGAESDVDCTQFQLSSFHPDWAFQIINHEGIPTAIRDGQWMGETAIVDHDGCEVPVSQIIIAHETSGGDIDCLSTIMRDISDQKRAEKEKLERLNLERERNHLQESLAAFDKMLGVLGHELRTPIAGVRAMAELILRNSARASSQSNDLVKSIHSEIIRMATLVNDLLEVSRMNSGQMKWQWARCQLTTICRDALATAEPLLDDCDVELTLSIQPRDLALWGDASALSRLLVNLLTNAIKHTTKGVIEIRAFQDSDHTELLHLCVCDTGRGMPSDIAKKLGVPFALNSGFSGSDYVSGSGLGLNICRGIVAAHGGRIVVETAINEGSTVDCILRTGLREPLNTATAAPIEAEVL